MITLQIPLKTFAKINGNEKCKGQTIICDTTYSVGELDYVDIIGLCRRKDESEITTVDQANVIIKLNNIEELIDAIKLYNPTDVWF
jgi:hypothetical protein